MNLKSLPPLPTTNFLYLPNELIIKILLLAYQSPPDAIKFSHLNSRIASLYSTEKCLTMHLDLLFIQNKSNLERKLGWFVEKIRGRFKTLKLDASKLPLQYSKLFSFGLKGIAIINGRTSSITNP
jgi:hypothetical protein